MLSDFYRKGRNYELFIRKTYGCEKGNRYGADEKLLIKLYLFEKGMLEEDQRIPISRQYFKVKLYMQKALAKLKKRKKYVNSYEHFKPLLVKLNNAESANELSEIATRGLAKIIELENYLARHR